MPTLETPVIDIRRLIRSSDDNFMDKQEYRTQQLILVPENTAVIVSDMWEEHWCKGATRRVAELASQMNELLYYLRGKGLQIIFCPSGTEEYYKDSYRKQQEILDEYKSSLTDYSNDMYLFNENIIPDIQSRIDPNRIQCDCFLTKCDSTNKPWKNKGQISTLDIAENDILTFDETTIISYLTNYGFEHVLMMGVHANMCVIYRSFGLKQLRMAGLKPIIVRDMTDSMTPREEAPYQDHFTALDYTIRFIEEYICPSTTSASLMGTSEFIFKEDLRRVTSSNWGPSPHKELFDDYDAYLNKGLLDPVKMTCWMADDGIGISAIEMDYFHCSLPAHGRKEINECSIPIPFGDYITSIKIKYGQSENCNENTIYSIELFDKQNVRLGGCGFNDKTNFSDIITMELCAPDNYRMNSINGWFTSEGKLGGLGFRCQPVRNFEVDNNGKIKKTDILVSYRDEQLWETFFINGCWRTHVKDSSELGYLYETWIHKNKTSSEYQKTKISDMKIVHQDVHNAERVAVKNLIDPKTEVDVRVYFDYNDEPVPVPVPPVPPVFDNPDNPFQCD